MSHSLVLIIRLGNFVNCRNYNMFHYIFMFNLQIISTSWKLQKLVMFKYKQMYTQHSISKEDHHALFLLFYNINLFHVQYKRNTCLRINDIQICFLVSHECFKPPQTQVCIHMIMNIKKWTMTDIEMRERLMDYIAVTIVNNLIFLAILCC